MALSTEQLAKYWSTADVLRKSLDAAEYKHIVLGLVFLKYVSDAFQERREELQEAFSDPDSERYKPDAKRLKAALDDRNYYKEVNVFWVPESSRWEAIQENAKQADISTRVDTALYEIEKENPKLEGIVERRYADARLPAADLGAVIDLIGSISFGNGREQASDVLGQVYEYFLGQFAMAEGKNAGQFYTTPSVVKVLVEILQPTSGRVYDPCCGSGGMFVQSERFLEAHGGKLGDIAIYGQESNPTTRRLCAMNLAIRGIDFDLGKTHGDTFLENQHPDKRFDFILMNPPFGNNASYPKAQLMDDVRWKKYGVPREKPANYAWMSHAVHHLAPKGRAGIVMPKNSLNSELGSDHALRKAFLEDDLVEAIVELPGGLFSNTSIPVSLWFFNKSKPLATQGKTLFISAKNIGRPVSKTQVEIGEAEIQRIAETFRTWADGGQIAEPDWANDATIDEISSKDYSLAPNRYVARSSDAEERPSLESASQTAKELAEHSRSLSALFEQLANGLEGVDSEPPLKLLPEIPFEAVLKTSGRSTSIPNSPRAKLATLTQKIFESWFIDFSILDELNSFSRHFSLPDMKDYYGDEFVSTDVGSFPQSWRVGELSEIAEVVDCLHSKKPELLEFGYPFVQLSCIRDDGSFDLGSLAFISQVDYEKWTKRIEVRFGDLVITNVGRVGAVAQVPPGLLAAIGRNITAIRPREGLQARSFLAELMFSKFMRREIEKNTDAGTVLDALNVKRISKLKVPIPPAELVTGFETVVGPLRQLSFMLDDNVMEDFLLQYRDSVL